MDHPFFCCGTNESCFRACFRHEAAAAPAWYWKEATTMPSLSPRPCMLQLPVSVTKKLQQRMRQNWDSTGMMYAGIRKESYAITHGKAEIVLTRFRSPTKPLVRKMSMRPVGPLRGPGILPSGLLKEEKRCNVMLISSFYSYETKELFAVAGFVEPRFTAHHDRSAGLIIQ